PERILPRKYFSKPILAACTHLPCADQLTFRGGIWGWATKAMPESPKSARQTAFHVGSASAGSPLIRRWMLRAVAVTMDSIMKPVLGTPTGTGVLPMGGMATQTPIAKI